MLSVWSECKLIDNLIWSLNGQEYVDEQYWTSHSKITGINMELILPLLGYFHSSGMPFH